MLMIGSISPRFNTKTIMFAVLMILAVSGLAQNTTPSDTPEDSTATVEEGFGGETNSDIDYEALVKELYGQEEKKKPEVSASETTVEKVEKSGRVTGPAPGLMKKSILHGSHLAFSASSPFAVAEQMSSWYSYIDMGVIFKLPYEIYVESLPLFLLVEVSTFNFENSYPEGGTFSGLSYIMQASIIGDNSGAAIGFGFWDGIMGSMLELNYRLRPTTNTFFRVGTRGVLITNVELLGASWWAELRLSMGLEL